jgi:hypothetical protein
MIEDDTSSEQWLSENILERKTGAEFPQLKRLSIGESKVNGL